MKSKYYLRISIILFIVSVFLPVYISDVNTDNPMGYDFLILGWMVYPSIDFFCWLGNFTLLLSWIFYYKKIGLVFSFITILLMFSFGINHVLELRIFEISEDGTLLGYYFWLSSSILLIFNKLNFDYLRK
jgi:hypothetical protein